MFYIKNISLHNFRETENVNSLIHHRYPLDTLSPSQHLDITRLKI